MTDEGPLDVLYDISGLGMAQQYGQCRTGVPRVVECLARQLARDPHCRLTFTASGFYMYAREYAAEQWPQATMPGAPTRAALSDRLRTADRALLRSPRPLPTRAMRFAIRTLDAAAPRVLSALGADPIPDADIYHATFLALPESTQRRTRMRRVQTVYDLIPVMHQEWVRYDKRNFTFPMLRALRPDDWALCVSHSTKADLCAYTGRDESRTLVTHLAADTETFHPCKDAGVVAGVRSRYGIPDGRYVLSVSTLEPRKNIDHLIRCFARLAASERLDDLSLVLAGSKGWDYEPVYAAIEQMRELRERVVVTGRVADEDLAALYSGADVFVYPSLYEGFGLPPLEAMQCGVPVITSNISSLPEVVGDAGILVNPHDADALCEALLNVLSDTALRSELANRSLVRARLFSWERCGRETLAAYRAAVAA